jgi:hypothetical protein
MPCYEKLLHLPSEHAIMHVDESVYAPVHDADFTGKRVKAYIESVFLAEEMKCQERFLSMPDHATAFKDDMFEEALLQSGLREILQNNRSQDGLYSQAHQFQRASVIKWKV